MCAYLGHGPQSNTRLPSPLTCMGNAAIHPVGLKNLGKFAGIPGGAPCTAAQPACTTRRGTQAPGCPSLETQRPSVSQAQQPRLKARLACWRCPRACSAADRPQAPAEGRQWHRQADRRLPWAQTRAPTPWLVFLLELPEGGKGDMRRDPGDVPQKARQQTLASSRQPVLRWSF